MNQTAEAALTAKVIFSAIGAALSWLLTYTGIDTEVFAIFSALIVVDFVTGIIKARQLGQRVTSNKAKYGVASKFSLVLLPIVMAAGAKAIGQDASTLFVWGMNLLIISEVYSVIGKIYTVRTGIELPEWDVISLLGKRIRERFEGGERV
jgi:phage-related holin